MVASMLIPSTVLASSIRPGTRVTHDSLNSGAKVRSKSPLCLGGTFAGDKFISIINRTRSNTTKR